MKIPVSFYGIREKPCVSTYRDTIDLIERAHDTTNITFLYTSLKGR